MPRRAIKTLEMPTRRAWRKWLRAHGESEAEIWLVFHKRHTGLECIGYDDAVEEALCFGWIDSLIRRLDDDRYARKFTPRKPDSRWSPANRRRYAKLEEQGLLAAAGRARAPTSRSAGAPSASKLPPYIEKELKANPRAWAYFENLAPSYRRAYIGWIDSAKRQETKARRLREAVTLLESGRRLGLK